MASATVPTNTTMKRRVRRNTRALPMIVTSVLVIGLGWFAWGKTHPPVDATSKLLTAPVTRGDLLETISATGSITAQTGAKVNIGSQITGTIKHLYADIGSYVKAGAPIAVLNLPDLEAQVHQAEASYAQAIVNLQQAQTRLAQQKNSLTLQEGQSKSAVNEAQAALNAASAHLDSAHATAQQQTAQTPEDVRRAETALGVSRAALSTARSTLKQVQASVNLQIATANEELIQANANSANSSAILKRNQDLLTKGFVAQSIVDQLVAQASVDKSKIDAAQQNVQLVKEKVAADVQSAKDQVTQAQQNVLAAQAALTSAKAGTYTVSARNADEQNALGQVNQSKANLATARANMQQIDIKRQDVEQAEQSVRVAQDAVRVAQAQVDYQKAQFAKTIIRTPISGTVLQLAQQQGETLAAGLSAPTLIVVADLTRLQVDAYVDETDIGKVRLGQEADITVDAYAKNPFKGKITKIASGSTIQQGVITYDVTFSIERPPVVPGKKRMDPTKLLKPDMTASVTIQTGKRQGVLLVPSESVKVGLKGATVNVLTTVDGKKDVKSVKVKTGGSDGVNTEIRDGVKEGDIIVRAGLQDPNKRQMGPSSPFGGGSKGGGGGKGK